MKKLKSILWYVGLFLYFPIYLLGAILNKIFRICVAFSLLLLADFRKAKDIIKYLFKDE